MQEKNKAAMNTCALTLGVGQEAVERREGWARGDSEGVELREAVSLGNTCTPREIMESGIWDSTHTDTHTQTYVCRHT